MRVAKPMLTFSSFTGQKAKNDIEIQFRVKSSSDEETVDTCKLYPSNKNDIYSEWESDIYLFADDFFLHAKKILTEHSTDSEIKKNTLKEIEEKISKNKFKHDTVRYYISKYLIYSLNTPSLRGIVNESREMPLGINGEGLDVLMANFSQEEWKELLKYNYLISWLDDLMIDRDDQLKFRGYKLGRSNSLLYFKDRFMKRNNNIFSSENANEGILHILFYLVLFISKKTPSFFAIDNIESSLNPKLCRTIMKEITKLAVEKNKQALITTHNPAILDGLNLFDDRQKLFVVKRTDKGHTKVEQIRLKPEAKEKNLKLSEMWMRGYLGGLPTNF